MRGALASIALGVCTLALPAVASADLHRYVERVGSIEVDGYEVKQGYLPAPHVNKDGFITHMEVNLVDPDDGTKIPIQRLMLHHIVFTNLGRHDATCGSFLNWDNETRFPDFERFYGAGEERAEFDMPPGYGYRLDGQEPWALTYMVMNHRAVPDEAQIRYRYTVDDSPREPVKPYWLDVENCQADPIYNVPGTGAPGSTQTRSKTFTIQHAGRIIGGGGHVHGGAKKLTLTEPDCDDRKIGQSVPTWGLPSHPFYNVKPVLHEPGPINMSVFGTMTGIPVAAGERITLNSTYDNSYPHTRVMGISVLYIARDDSVTQPCGPMPDDIVNIGTNRPGRTEAPRYKIPLTGLDEDGNAVTIDAPPGALKDLPSGSTVKVGDRFFSRPNVRLKKGSKLNWDFDSEELHNVTLANGPKGIGSPNLDGGREFSERFRKSGTYRLFCALHPVQMSERVVVEK